MPDDRDIVPMGKSMTHCIWRLVFISASLLATVAGCSPAEPVFHATGKPARLSEWNLFDNVNAVLTPAPATLVFKPANPLFTDYAQKLRSMWLPANSEAQWQDGEISFPLGTILSKTFYYPTDAAGIALQIETLNQNSIDLQHNRLVETRLLVRRANGWEAFPYVWNEQQTEAFLRVAGSTEMLDIKSDTGTFQFSYFVPNENQCAGCHVTEHPNGGLHPLAATAQQLQTPFNASNNDAAAQIEAMRTRGWLSDTPPITATTSWTDTSASIPDRALAYLEVHCGHCHNPQGAADTSALLLNGSTTAPVNLGVCKSPVAAGGGAGDRLFAIVPGAPERSILLYRMESTAPDEMMPELGRSLLHAEGIALIRQWIAEMPGNCQTSGVVQ